MAACIACVLSEARGPPTAAEARALFSRSTLRDVVAAVDVLGAVPGFQNKAKLMVSTWLLAVAKGLLTDRDRRRVVRAATRVGSTGSWWTAARFCTADLEHLANIAAAAGDVVFASQLLCVTSVGAHPLPASSRSRTSALQLIVQGMCRGTSAVPPPRRMCWAPIVQELTHLALSPTDKCAMLRLWLLGHAAPGPPHCVHFVPQGLHASTAVAAIAQAALVDAGLTGPLLAATSCCMAWDRWPCDGTCAFEHCGHRLEVVVVLMHVGLATRVRDEFFAAAKALATGDRDALHLLLDAARAFDMKRQGGGPCVAQAKVRHLLRWATSCAIKGDVARDLQGAAVHTLTQWFADPTTQQVDLDCFRTATSALWQLAASPQALRTVPEVAWASAIAGWLRAAPRGICAAAGCMCRAHVRCKLVLWVLASVPLPSLDNATVGRLVQWALLHGGAMALDTCMQVLQDRPVVAQQVLPQLVDILQVWPGGHRAVKTAKGRAALACLALTSSDIGVVTSIEVHCGRGASWAALQAYKVGRS